MIEPKEKDMRMALEQAAKLGGWRCFFTFDSRHSPAGWPDMWFLRGGEFIFWELKRSKTKTTPAQDEVLAALKVFGEAHGLLLDGWLEVDVIRPADLDRAIARLLMPA